MLNIRPDLSHVVVRAQRSHVAKRIRFILQGQPPRSKFLPLDSRDISTTGHSLTAHRHNGMRTPSRDAAQRLDAAVFRYFFFPSKAWTDRLDILVYKQRSMHRRDKYEEYRAHGAWRCRKGKILEDEG